MSFSVGFDIGSFLGGSGGTERTSRRQIRHDIDMFNRNRDLQVRMAKRGLGWRIADARASGIHPLAAIGMSSGAGASFAGGASPLPSSSGSNVSASFGNKPSDLETELMQANIDESRARKSLFEAQAQASLEARGIHNNNVTQDSVRLPHMDLPMTDPTFSKREVEEHSGDVISDIDAGLNRFRDNVNHTGNIFKYDSLELMKEIIRMLNPRYSFEK